MADTKISALVDGGAPQATDEFVIARAGDNFKVDYASLESASLAGAVILAPASSARNVVIPTAGTVIAQIWKAHAAQSVDLTQWQTSTGAVLASIGAGGGWLMQPSDDTLSALVTLQAPVGFSANSPDGYLWQAITEDGVQTFVMDAYGGWQLVAPTGEGAAVIALRAEVADGAYSLNLASGRINPALDYFINATIPDSIVPATPRSVFYVYKTGAMWVNPTLATVQNWGVLPGGHESLGALAAIADGDVRTNERVQWYDATTGSPVLRFKMRDAAGTLVTGVSASEAFVTTAVATKAPSTATYITQTADAGLSAEQALSALATGLVKNTTGTGVLSIGAQGTDYYAPGGTDVAVTDGGTGASTAAAALTNLGLSAFIQTLVDDATAAAARATLAVHPSRTLKTGLYYNCLPDPVADGTFAPTFQQVIYSPFPVSVGFTADRISLGVATAGTAGARVRLGIYNDDGTGQPGSLLLDAGVINGDSNTYQEITINQALAGGTLYWTAVCWQVQVVGSGVLRGSGVANGGAWWVGKVANSTDIRIANYKQAGVAGAFGAATPSTTGAEVGNPNVRIRSA